MHRQRRGSLSCGEESEDKSEKNRESQRPKKSASAEPFAISSNDSATGSIGSRGKKKKFSFWSNLFKSKISEQEENDGIGIGSSYESVNSAATTNSFAFVSPKKYRGKGNKKGKRIPVDDQTLPRSGRERDGSLSRNRNRGNKIGTLSRISMKMGLKKKYNLQSCESLEHIVNAPLPVTKGSGLPPVVANIANAEPQPVTKVLLTPPIDSIQSRNEISSDETADIPKSMEASPQMSSGYDSSTWGTNTRRKRRAPQPPVKDKKSISSSSSSTNNVIDIPGKNCREKVSGESNVVLKSVTGIDERELEKRESYPSGALRRNKSKERFPRPCSCSGSMFAHHSKYQPRRYCSENCNSNTNTKTRTHVKGKKKAPPPPNPFGDPDAPDDASAVENPLEKCQTELNQNENTKPNNNNNNNIEATKSKVISTKSPGKNNVSPVENYIVPVCNTMSQTIGNDAGESSNPAITSDEKQGSGRVKVGGNFQSEVSTDFKSIPEKIDGNAVSSGNKYVQHKSREYYKGSKNTPVAINIVEGLQTNEIQGPVQSSSDIQTKSGASTKHSQKLCPSKSKENRTVENGGISMQSDAPSTPVNRNEEVRLQQQQALATSSNKSAPPGTSSPTTEFNQETLDEIAQNAQNDRQEKEEQLLVTSSINSVSKSQTTSSSSTAPAVSLSCTKSSSSGSKNKLFNFSKSRMSQQPDRVTDGDLQEAQNELESLLHSSGTLKAQAKKVDEQVKAQLVELKKESDKSPLLFFASKTKKSTITNSSSSSSSCIQNTPPPLSSTDAPSSPESTLGSDTTKVTPRPWYRRSISSSKSPIRIKPKIPPKPTITMLPKFSDLDREAQTIFEENRRKSAEIAFNENARELINMFNTTFSPTSEEPSNNDREIINNHSSAISPPSSSQIKDKTIVAASTTSSGGTRLSSLGDERSPTITGSLTPKPLFMQFDEQKNIAVVQPQSKQTLQNIELPVTISSQSKVSSQNSISTGENNNTLTVNSTTSVPVLSATVSPNVRGSTSIITVPTSTKTSSIMTTTSLSTTSGPSIAATAQATKCVSVPQVVISRKVEPTSITASTTINNNASTITTNSTVASYPKSSEPEWTCSRCTLKNAPWRALCEACFCRKVDYSSSINPMSSIFEQVNANKSTTIGSSNVVNNSSAKSSTTTEISKKPMQLVKPKSFHAPPSCENFLSQLPSKEGLSKEEKLQGIKLSPIEDPEVEELDIEKLREARLAFFAKDQQNNSRISAASRLESLKNSKPNNFNLAVYTSSGGKNSNESKANVFSDGEDDTIDSLLRLSNGLEDSNTNPTTRNGPHENSTIPKTASSNPQPLSDSIPTIAPSNSWKPQSSVPYRFRPMLESIFESDSNYYSTGEFDRIYENWQLNQQIKNISDDRNTTTTRSASPSSIVLQPTPTVSWANTFMQQTAEPTHMKMQPNFHNAINPNIITTTNKFNVVDYPETDDVIVEKMRMLGISSSSETFSNFRSFNNPVVYPSGYTYIAPHGCGSPIDSDPNFYLNNNNSASSSDTEGATIMDRESRQRNSSFGERQLTYEDYRKLGAIPKGFCSGDSEISHGGDGFCGGGGEDSRRRSSKRRQRDDEARHFIELSESFSTSAENTIAVGKLLKKLEWAIAHGEHRLAAALAKNLSLLKVNCVVAKPNREPITIRVYVEDRFMQQGPFHVQVVSSMTLRELKSKIERDWGIPSGFQKWILGKKMAEDDCETLNFYEVVNDTMAFLYLVTPQIEKSISPRPKDPLAPPLPSKPSNNMMAIEFQSEVVQDFQDNVCNNTSSGTSTSDTKKLVNAQIHNVPTLAQTDKINLKKDSIQNKKEEEPSITLYEKPSSPNSNIDSSITHPKTVECRKESSSIQLQPTPIARTRASSTSRDTPEKILPSIINSNQISPNLMAIKISKDTKQAPCSVNKQSEIKKSTNISSNQPSVIHNSELEPVKSSSNVDKSKPTSPPPTNSVNNNLPISLQQKLVNLKEAAEQAFGKSFGQVVAQNSEKQSVSSNSSPENKVKSKLATTNSVTRNSIQEDTNVRLKSGPTNSNGLFSSTRNFNKDPPTPTSVLKVSSVGKSSERTQLEVKDNLGLPKNSLLTSKVDKTKDILKYNNMVLTTKTRSTESPKKELNLRRSSKMNENYEIETGKSKDKSKNALLVDSKVSTRKIINTPDEKPEISSELAINISEPIPKPRIKKQPVMSEISSESPSSQVNISKKIETPKSSSISNEHDNQLRMRPLLENRKSITSSVEKVEITISENPSIDESPSSKFKVKSDGSCQTTLAFPPSNKSQLRQNIMEEPKLGSNSNKSVTAQASTTSPSPNKSPSPTTNHQNQSSSPPKIKSQNLFKSDQNAVPIIQNAVSVLALINQPLINKIPNKPSTSTITTSTLSSSSSFVTSDSPINATDINTAAKLIRDPSVHIVSPIISTSTTPVRQNNNNSISVPLITQASTSSRNTHITSDLPMSKTVSDSSNAIPMQIKSVTAPQNTVVGQNPKGQLETQQPTVYKCSSYLLNSSPKPFKISNGISGVVSQFPSSQLKSSPVLPAKEDELPKMSISPVQSTVSMQRRNSDSSIINMDIAASDESKRAKTPVIIEGATALPDDNKEDNIQTYLSMLQLMEKQDLILTSDMIECPICFLKVPPGEGCILRDCLHSFCRECLIGAVQYAEESEVKCPFGDRSYNCSSSLQEREIKALVPAEVFEKYLAQSVKLAERKMINTFHCKTNDCTGWCIFEDDVNTFLCPVCSIRNCITCAAIHNNMDCQQYQRELAIAAETDENAKSSRLMLEKMIQRGEALECPACHVVLLKKWGCDWVKCSYCKTEICWITKNFRWGPSGKGDISGGCKCGVNGVRCHPKCTYCH